MSLFSLKVFNNRYAHFDDPKSRCALFRDQDYLPTEEKDLQGFDNMDDLKGAINDLEHAVENNCPRCGKVRCIIVYPLGA